MQVEVTFAVEPLSPEVEARVEERFDALVGGHSSGDFVTITAQGSTVPDAVAEAAEDLEAVGVCIQRVREDFVSRRDIAERTGVTTQAVGLWARGERQQADPFPLPYSAVSGGIWLWGDVVPWLRRNGHDVDAGMTHLSRDDLVSANAILATRVRTSSPQVAMQAAGVALSELDGRVLRLLAMQVPLPEIAGALGLRLHVAQAASARALRAVRAQGVDTGSKDAITRWARQAGLLGDASSSDLPAVLRVLPVERSKH